MKEEKEIKEDFCPSCVVVPLAFAGVGVSAYSQTNGQYKKQKKIMLWVGVGSVLVSLAIFVYFKYIKKCNECLNSSI